MGEEERRKKLQEEEQQKKRGEELFTKLETQLVQIHEQEERQRQKSAERVVQAPSTGIPPRSPLQQTVAPPVKQEPEPQEEKEESFHDMDDEASDEEKTPEDV